MHQDFALLDVNLRLFDGGAAAAGTGDGAGTDGGTAAETQLPPDLGRRAKKNKTGESAENVVYGIQDNDDQAAADPQPDTKEPEQKQTDPKAEFDALIKGEFKDLFAERVQQVIDRRFKETKGLQEQLQAVAPILDILKSRYRIEDSDPAKLVEAIERDDAYWSDAAEQAGMTVEQYKAIDKTRREYQRLQSELQAAKQQEALREKFADWHRQAEELKATMPSFDFTAEMQNPDFGRMLNAGIPVRQAFYVMHLNELQQATAMGTAQATQQQVINNVRARGARPAENGVQGNQSGVIVKNDPAKWSKEDRMRVIRQVEAGREIKL